MLKQIRTFQLDIIPRRSEEPRGHRACEEFQKLACLVASIPKEESFLIKEKIEQFLQSLHCIWVD